jgi:hypothetical protein
MNHACDYPSPAWRDLQQASALSPGDREASLAMLAYQCMHAERLAWAMSNDDDDDDAAELCRADLEAHAVAGLRRLMRDNAGDAGFVLKIIGAIDGKAGIAMRLATLDPEPAP